MTDKNSRKELENLLNEEKYFIEGFLKIPQMEQDYIVNNLEIPKGIAKNKCLKENLFISFFCMINNIPIITCGKPGRSKTLSFQILQKSMKGKNSKSEFCKEYPEIKVVRIQGSLYTTSSEIINAFEKGRNIYKENPDKLLVICFDEMGLAELSENNPLKVLHFELENEENKLSFLGISNWFIDASKMNRVVYNVVQDPDEEDIIETSKEIVKSYEENEENYIEKYGNIILCLSKAYYKFINKKKEENHEDQNFHGSRDFFCLIKSIIKDIINNKEIDNKGEEEEKEKILNICLNNIQRNFGGLKESVYEFVSYFLEGYEGYLNNININNYKKYNTLECIEKNIIDESSRYLLLIIDNCFSQELLGNILDEINKKNINELENDTKNKGIETLKKKIKSNKIEKVEFKKFLNGSKYKADQNNLENSSEMLRKIIDLMETETILILKDVESVYPALYELFNQSFEFLPGKKSVHIGDSNSLALVNNKFKVIVLVDENQIKDQDPPFLNRFEKHIFNLSVLLSNELISLSEEIYDILKQIINLDNKYKNLKGSFKEYIKFIKLKEIKALVYFGEKIISNDKKNDYLDKNAKKEKIIEFVLEKIAPCFNEILMILITKFGFKNKYNFYFKIIYENYKKKYCHNIKNYLEKLDDEISIVYTFSSIVYDVINEEDKINNKGKIFNKSSTYEINMNNIYSMKQISQEIINFYYDQKKNISPKNLLILKFNENDLNKLNDIYYLLKEIRTNDNYGNVIFIIYLENHNIKNISFLSNCPQLMISNLNNKYTHFLDYLEYSNEILIEKNIIDINTMINDNIEKIINYFCFNLYNCEDINQICFSTQFIDNIKNQQYLKDIFIKCFIYIINNEDDYIFKIFKEIIENSNERIEKKILYLLNNKINDYFILNIKKIIYFLEKEQILSTFIFNNKNNNYNKDDSKKEKKIQNPSQINIYEHEIIKNIINDYILTINSEENKKLNLSNTNLHKKIMLPILMNQNLPFSENNFKSLFEYIINNISKKYLEKENYLLLIRFKEQDEEKIEKLKKKYLNQIQNLDDNLKNELSNSSKYKIIIDILNSKNQKLIEILIEDCFYIFFKNNQFISKYKKLSEILNLLIQLRLRTRLNNNLNIDFVKNEKIKLYLSFMELIIEENKKIKTINQNEEKKNDANLLDNNKTCIEYIDENEIKENNIFLSCFISIINFLQSYSKEIKMILDLYHFLLKSDDEHNENSLKNKETDASHISIYEKITKLIENNKIKMEDTKRNPEHNRINKLPFFYIIVYLTKIFKDKLVEILDKKNNDDYINSIQNHINNLLKLEKRFHLFCQDIFDLDIINKIIYKMKSISNWNTSAIGIESLKIFLVKEQKIVLNKQNDGKQQNHEQREEEENSNIIKKKIAKIQITILMISKIFGQNLEEYSYLANKIIFNYVKMAKGIEKEKIIDEVLLKYNFPYHNKILEYSYPLIKEILGIKKNFLIDKKKSKLLDYFEKDINNTILLDSKNIPEIKNILLYRFEIVFEKYFNNILLSEKKKDMKDLNVKLCGKVSKKFLEEAIDQFYEQKEDKNMKYLCNIYCIAFIKRYLKYYIDILFDDERYQQFSEREEINKILFNKNCNIIKRIETIKYYVIKLILNKLNKNSKDYEKKIDKFRFKEFECFKKKIDENDYLLEIPTLLLDIIDKEIEQYNEIVSKINEKGFNKKIFTELFVNKEEFIYDVLSNSLIIINCINQNLNYNQLISSIIKYLNENYNDTKNNEISSFLNIFFIDKNFKEKIIPKIKSELNDSNKITILLFSLRFIFSFLLRSKKGIEIKGFYYHLLSNKIDSVIENCFIPGNLEFLNLKTHLNKQEEKIREMDNITFRLLNFVFYSFLFYSNIQGNLKDQYLNKYIPDSMTCFTTLEKNWELMQDNLRKIDLDIRIFLNLIFNDIKEKLISCPNFKTKNEAIIFEKEINQIIKNTIKGQKLIESYIKENDFIKNDNKKKPKKLILLEYYEPKIYSFLECPDLRYFNISELPSKENFIDKFFSNIVNKEKYPIINMIINENEFNKKLKLLKYIPKMNKLCNYFINNISHKYTREQAKNLQIEKEIYDEDIIILLKEFIPIYKQIRPFIKIEEIGEEDFVDLENNLYLSNLCVDSNEKNYGFILLAIYKEMAECQNTFINNVINSKNVNLKSNKYMFNLDIKIQECDEEQILILPSFEDKEIENNTNEEKFNLMETVIDNSLRKENKIIYNLDEIEEKLASHILPKIKKLKINEFNKVIYKDENLLKNIDIIMSNYINKYPQRELTEKEVNIVYDYISNNDNFDAKDFLINIKYLIYDIINDNPKEEEKLYQIIENKNIYNNETLKDFFESMKNSIENENNNEINNNNGKNNDYFTLKCLINLIDFVELLCWDSIKKENDTNYYTEIDDNIKMKLNNYFGENNNENISKIDLCSAIRRFISWYLLEKSDIDPKSELKNYLNKDELWTLNLSGKNIGEKINKIFEDILVNISQSFKLYEYLGKDKSRLDKYNFIEKLNKEEIENGENGENENDLNITNTKENETDNGTLFNPDDNYLNEEEKDIESVSMEEENENIEDIGILDSSY